MTMNATIRYFLSACVLAAMTAAAAAQSDDEARLSLRAPAGSVARQLDLKMRLLRANSGVTLAAALNHNRHEWESLSPDQRDRYRREYVAFLRESPEQQREMIEKLDKLIAASAEQRADYRQRARWLKVVLASFTDAQREQLKAMTPEQRAKALVERRDELIRTGKLQLEDDAPATQPQ